MYKKIIIWVIMIILMSNLTLADFEPYGNIVMNDQNITGANKINATIYYGNGSKLTGITNSEANSSEYWDDINTFNSTQMENSGGYLNILVSWLESLFISDTDEGNLNVNSSDYWDGLNAPTDIPHATPSNGDITHFSLADEIYDWVMGLNYITNSVNNLSNYYLKTEIDTQGEMETIWGTTLSTDSERTTGLAGQDACSEITGCVENAITSNCSADQSCANVLYTTDKYLGGLSCADTEIAKWNNTSGAWECESDETGGSGGVNMWVDGGTYLYPNSTYASDINVTGNLTIADRLTKNNDIDTYFDYPALDQMEFWAGGLSFMHLIETDGGDSLTVNQDSNDIDFRVESDGYTHALFVDGSSGYIRMNNLTNCDTIDTDADGILSCGTDDNTNANTICSGTTTYLDGDGSCDDISSVYEVQLNNEAGLYAALSDVTQFYEVGDKVGDADTLDTHDTSYFQTDLTNEASLYSSLSDVTEFVETNDSANLYAVSLTSALTVANGGTGTQSFTDGAVLFGNSAGAIEASAQMPSGSIIIGVAEGTNPTAAFAFTSHDAGTLKHEYGGLEANVVGYTNGLYGMIGGSTADIDNSSEVASVIDDETGTGLMVFSNSPTLVTPTLGVASATTLNTGEGANELYDMNQNVLTTSDVTFNNATVENVLFEGGNSSVRTYFNGSCIITEVGSTTFAVCE